MRCYAIFNVECKQLSVTLTLSECLLRQCAQPLSDALRIQPFIHANVGGVRGTDFFAGNSTEGRVHAKALPLRYASLKSLAAKLSGN